MQFEVTMLVFVIMAAYVASTPVGRVKRQMGMGMGMGGMGGMGMGGMGMGMGMGMNPMAMHFIEDFAEPCEMSDCLGMRQYMSQRRRLAASRMMARFMGRTGRGAGGAGTGLGAGLGASPGGLGGGMLP